ncbi:MAG: chromosome condensation regulator RCC1 [Gemmatimonadetes bacterium]|nr:MAG: chromosome condensation regulator RCC1 [Gemmatimonadota bacterium]
MASGPPLHARDEAGAAQAARGRLAESARAGKALGGDGVRVVGRTLLGIALAACGGDVVGPKPLPLASVSAGSGHACGLTPAGAAYCWGYNGYGDLGNGANTSTTTAVPVSGGLTFATVSVGDGVATLGQHTCGLTGAGAARCWGYNAFGQLGNGTTSPSATPIAVSGGLTFVAVSAGGTHTCALTSAGAAYCWGANASGNLGDSTRTDSKTPVLVSGGLTFGTVSSGEAHTCAVTAAGAAYCWGFNFDGELGDGTTTNRSTPVAVSGGLSFAAVSSGGQHTCGITPAGAAYCWGNNGYGQLGSGTTSYADTANPVLVSGALTFAAVSSGAFHTCGVTRAGAVYCWGHNSVGELGNGTMTDSATPVAVSGGLTVSAVSGGYSSTCALTAAGTAYCWGYNGYGQLGNGTTRSSSVPVRVGQ